MSNPQAPPFIARRAGVVDVDALVGLMRDFYAESGYPLDAGWAADSFRTLVAQPALGTVWLAQAGVARSAMRC